jgi:cytochrome P450
MAATDIGSASTASAPLIRFHDKLVDLVRDPFRVVAGIGEQYPGQVVRLGIPGRPLLAHDADHVRRVLGDETVYARGGLMWEATARLQGKGILGEGAQWQASRAAIGPMFTGPAIRALMDETLRTIHDSMADLANRAGPGRTCNGVEEMITITRRVLARAFLGDRIPEADAGSVAVAVNAAFGALSMRLLLPAVPLWVPLPGDGTFRQNFRLIQRTLGPYISQAREEERGWDILSAVAHAKDEQGNAWPDDIVLSDMIGMFLAGTETTAHTLIWWLILLDEHPEVAAQVLAEIRRVVGSGPVVADHYRDLTYTRAAFKETLRLRPMGWMLPRQAQRDDVLGGVHVRAGEVVIACPYITHRDPQHWDDPLRFDPDRWLNKGEGPVPAYIPFADGPHRCIGAHFFAVESALIAAALLSQFDVQMDVRHPVRPKPSGSLRPGGPTRMKLRPRR